MASISFTSAVSQEGRDNLRESFARDMAAHQRMRGVDATPGANQALATRTFERWDRKWQEAKAPPPGQAVDPWPTGERPSDVTARKLGEARGVRYRIVREPELERKSREVILSPARRQELLWLDARVILLGTGRYPDGRYTRVSIMETGPLGQPSWFQRINAAIVTNLSKCRSCAQAKLDRCEHKKREAAVELLRICEDSIAVFGEWKRDPFRQVWLT
jgi:hypothetical protein